MTRHSKRLWIKDVSEHVNRSQRNWRSADEDVELLMADSLRCDLEVFSCLCNSMMTDPVEELDRRMALCTA